MGREAGTSPESVSTFGPSGPLKGVLVPPPDKSISHRAALVAAMSDGPTVIRNYLDSADTRSTLAAVAALGAVGPDLREPTLPSEFVIEGVGLQGPTGDVAIDVGNAGTLIRLLPGWLAGCDGRQWRLDGDSSIRSRPVDRIATPLREMGAVIEVTEDRFPPIDIHGSSLSGIEYELPVASAQVKSCLLLAGLTAAGSTTVIEPIPTRNHTELILRAAGADIDTGPGRTTIRGGGGLGLDQVEVPGDLSSAAFFMTAAALIPGSELRIEQVGINPTRMGLVSVLRGMGADISVETIGYSAGEELGAIEVRAAALASVDVGGEEVPLAIDELPLIALAAVFAEGTTRITGAAELRVKESDRIAAVTEALGGLGARIESSEDGMVIEGTGRIGGGSVEAGGDHRIAMLGAVAGLLAEGPVEVFGMDAAAVSYPRFQLDLAGLLGGP